MITETFAALAEPHRYRIVELLRAGDRTVAEIGVRLTMDQPKVSKHLRILKKAGLVHVEPRAQERVYRLRAQRLREMHRWIERYREIWDIRFGALDELLVELEGAPDVDGPEPTKEKPNARKERR